MLGGFEIYYTVKGYQSVASFGEAFECSDLVYVCINREKKIDRTLIIVYCLVASGNVCTYLASRYTEYRKITRTKKRSEMIKHRRKVTRDESRAEPSTAKLEQRLV